MILIVSAPLLDQSTKPRGNCPSTNDRSETKLTFIHDYTCTYMFYTV